MAKRNASGAGSIRQRPDGRWEGRITVGRDPGTGKQLRRSVYGATQAEVVKVIQRLQAERESGTYQEPSKLTVSAWLDIWLSEYLGGSKEATQAKYESCAKNHIKPALGAVKLQKLKPHQIQAFYNSLISAGKSAKYVRDINGILHAAMQQAVKLGYLHVNPTEGCVLPRAKKKEMQVMDDDAVLAFLEAIKGNPYEILFFVVLFTGMRQSEALGLCWDMVDFNAGTITISRQLLTDRKNRSRYYLDETKSSKVRKVMPAPMVMDRLKARQLQQIEWRLRAGPAWENAWNLVFTNELGSHLAHNTVRKYYNRVVDSIGRPGLRFHDTRHSFAVMSIVNGDDIKTVQDNLGHHSAAFTLDTYAHVTEKMQADSAARMEERLKRLAGEK